MTPSPTRQDDALNGALVVAALALTLLMNLPWFQDRIDPPAAPASAPVAFAAAKRTTTAPASHQPPVLEASRSTAGLPSLVRALRIASR